MKTDIVMVVTETRNVGDRTEVWSDGQGNRLTEPQPVLIVGEATLEDYLVNAPTEEARRRYAADPYLRGRNYYFVVTD